MSSSGMPALQVVTEHFPHSGSLVEFLDERSPLLFVRRNRGLVGRGICLSRDFSGASRFDDASTWWREIVSEASVEDPVQRPGTGLVALGAFTFSPHSRQQSSLTIPREVTGADESGWWRTTISLPGGESDAPADQAANERHAMESPQEPRIHWSSGAMSADDYVRSVSRATTVVSSGITHKVVLARDLVGVSDPPVSIPLACARLTEAYPDTHVFAIGGHIGASPETLASVRGKHLSLRVLAGSTSRGDSPVSDREQAEALVTSAKDLDEHRFAVASVVDSLRSRAIPVVADDEPFTIKLPNLWHLATDVAAQLPEDASVLDAVAALHPTAAVAGSPTEDALRLIRELEPFDRGLYAGPVGWIDSHGDGDWAISLRCAELSDDRTKITAFAGAGIVAESIPDSELLETELKFLPIKQAFSPDS